MTTYEFNTAFEPLNKRLYAFAMKLTRSQNRADDLIQETVYRAFKNRDSFKVGTNFKGWITTIMYNTFVNNYRKTKKRNQVEEPVDSFLFAVESHTISNTAEGALTMEELKSIIDTIGEDYKVPFLMFYNGYQYQEIAEHMNIPIGTVKSRIFFARKKLKAIISARY